MVADIRIKRKYGVGETPVRGAKFMALAAGRRNDPVSSSLKTLVGVVGPHHVQYMKDIAPEFIVKQKWFGNA